MQHLAEALAKPPGALLTDPAPPRPCWPCAGADAEALREAGVPRVETPPQASTQGLVAELAARGQAAGACVLCPVPAVLPPLAEPPVVPRFLAALEAAGAAAVRVDAYETGLGATPAGCAPERALLEGGAVDAIAFTSTAEVGRGGVGGGWRRVWGIENGSGPALGGGSRQAHQSCLHGPALAACSPAPPSSSCMAGAGPGAAAGRVGRGGGGGDGALCAAGGAWPLHRGGGGCGAGPAGALRLAGLLLLCRPRSGGGGTLCGGGGGRRRRRSDGGGSGGRGRSGGGRSCGRGSGGSGSAPEVTGRRAGAAWSCMVQLRHGFMFATRSLFHAAPGWGPRQPDARHPAGEGDQQLRARAVTTTATQARPDLTTQSL